VRIIVLILLATLLLASCTTNIGVSERNGWTFSEASFRARTETVTRSINVIDPPKQLALTYEMEVNSGEIDLHLIDPNGRVLWDGQFATGADVQECHTVTLTERGTWSLQITTQSANGRYRIRWDQNCPE
jgi:hypothetical protein